jgi:hypothetical protein
VFILGAGFSYNAGFPLAYHLLRQVYERLDRETQSELYRTLQFLYPEVNAAKTISEGLTQVGVEDFMSLLDVSEQFNARLPTTWLRSTRIRSLRARMLTAIADLMIDCQVAAENQGRCDYVDRFVRRLWPTDTVITFNWDVLLERRLVRNDVRYAYKSRERGKALLLLKLHGSIDWRHGETLDSIHHLTSVHRQLFQLPWDRLMELRDAGHHNDAPPYVVPPTFFKDLQGSTDLEELWVTAFRQVVLADEIHFCGYRLPPEDMYARSVLRRAIRQNARERKKKEKPAAKITLVNPDSNNEVIGLMRKFLDRSVKPEKDKFEESRWGR